MLLLWSNGMLLHWLLPSGLRWLLHSGMPLSSSRWFLHSGRGMLLSSSRWFLHSGRVHSRRGMLLPNGLDHDLLLPFPEILGLGVASLRLKLIVQIFV
ncbi:hypothetical protein B296_00012725 [Ensete ventricosum]|uniref:Uncharacterized protein n=1 Tax=Ensete ventricosum TaxID=4639 RepID=A0A426ZKT8_ENSVE|nr:hypothetical protein B296_00012725 [Ensete ventricosum]